MDRAKVIKELEEISDYFFDIYRNEKNGYSPAQEYCNAAEDALALLKDEKEYCDKCAESAIKTTVELQEEIARLRSLLKEQEAVEPKWFIDAHHPAGAFRCSSCGERIVEKDIDFYCSKCGKPILWERR